MKYISVSENVIITLTIWLVLCRYNIDSLLSKFIQDIRCHHNLSIMTNMWIFFLVCMLSQMSIQLLGLSCYLCDPLCCLLDKELKRWNTKKVKYASWKSPMVFRCSISLLFLQWWHIGYYTGHRQETSKLSARFLFICQVHLSDLHCWPQGSDFQTLIFHACNFG